MSKGLEMTETDCWLRAGVSTSQNEAPQVGALAGCDRLFIDKASGKNATVPS